MKVECPTTQRVIDKMVSRAEAGMEEFGVTMPEREDYTAPRLLREIQEELLDAAVYIEALLERMEPAR